MATQPNKDVGKRGEDNDGNGVNYSKLWEEAFKAVAERDAAELERKKKEEEIKKQAWESLVQLAKKKEEERERKMEELARDYRKKKEEDEERKRKMQEASGSSDRPPCADQEDRPRSAYRTAEAHGKVVPTCWCNDPCIVKESQDFGSHTRGRKFFMCPNYSRSPERPRNRFDTPPSPPPLCRYYTWIDLEQDAATLALVKIENRIIRSRWNEEVRREEQEEKRKKREAILRKKEEEEKRIAKEAREAERARKRERARVAEEEDKKRDKTGKWPRVLDL